MTRNPVKTKPDTKRPRLTLSELASYDDICTDALVDNVFFWSTIRKNRPKYNSGRGFSEDDVTKILFNRIICDGSPKLAEVELLRLNGFKKFFDRLKTPRERDNFMSHLRKYVNIWLPDCPWEVTTTNRYTIITHEAAIVAKRDIKKNETIKYLCGTLVTMTNEEEKDLDLTRRDFSVVRSSRSQKTSLFLGPARFANHDCNSNARLSTIGSSGMSIVAARLIKEGEEITVTYGEDYFGVNNCECLCGSCEQAAIGGWTKSNNILSTETTALENGTESYSLRSKRRRQRESFSPMTPDVETFTMIARRLSTSGSRTPIAKLSISRGQSVQRTLNRVSSALARFSPERNDESAFVHDEQHTALEASVLHAPPLEIAPESEVKQELAASDLITHSSAILVKEEVAEDDASLVQSNVQLPTSTDIVDKLEEGPIANDTQARGNGLQVLTPASSSVNCSPMLQIIGDARSMIRQESRLSSSPESVFEQNPSTQLGTPLSSQADGNIEEPSIVKLEEDNKLENEGKKRTSAMAFDDDLSEMDSDEEFDDSIEQIVARRRRGKAGKSKKMRTSHLPEVPEPQQIRLPGDYMMTPVLLAEPCSRWNQCQTCQGVWVQANGYCTRRECPRCERHSKLYGYKWPKVHDDLIPRTTDHRTIHRFLSEKEEKELRSKTKFLGG